MAFAVNPQQMAAASRMGSFADATLMQQPVGTRPATVVGGMPDPATVESRKLACQLSLEEQMQKGEEILQQQQLSQAEYIKQCAEAQKRQLATQIDMQAQQQEILLSQRYAEQKMKLQQEFLKQQMVLESQASEISKEYQLRKSQEELAQQQQQFGKQTAEQTRQLQEAAEPAKPKVTQWLYNPDIKAPVDIRSEPDINGPRTNFEFNPGDVFMVSEERAGAEGVTYLKLADGRGWMFDKKPGAGNMCTRQPEAAQSATPATGSTAPCPPSAPSGPTAAAAPASTASLRPGSAPMASGPAISQWLFCPEKPKPMDTRTMPDVNSGRTSSTIQPGEVFAVCEERPGADGITYLRLQDGRGWVFDGKPGIGVLCVRHPAAGAPTPAPNVAQTAAPAAVPRGHPVLLGGPQVPASQQGYCMPYAPTQALGSGALPYQQPPYNLPPSQASFYGSRQMM